MGPFCRRFLIFFLRPVGIISSSFHCKYLAFYTRYGALYGGKKIAGPPSLRNGKFKTSACDRPVVSCLLAGCCWLLLVAAGLDAGWLAGWLLTGCWLAKGFAADCLSVCWPCVDSHARAFIPICCVVYGIKTMNRTCPYIDIDIYFWALVSEPGLPRF